MHRMGIAIGAFLLVPVLTVADLRIETLITSGEPLPGSPGVFIDSFSAFGRQDSKSRVVLRVTLSGDVTTANNSALLRVGNRIEVLVREGDQIPGSDATFGEPSVIQTNPRGEVLFSALKVRDPYGTWATFIWRPNGIESVVDGDTQVPGRPLGERFTSTGHRIGLTASGEVYFSATTNAQTPFRGIWFGRPGALELLFGSGMQVPEMPAGNIVWWGAWLEKVGADEALFGGYVNTAYNIFIWRHSRGHLEVVARRGDRLPGMSESQYATNLWPGDMTQRGNFAFRAHVPGGQYRWGYWAGEPGSFYRVALVDQVAPTGDAFYQPHEVRISPGGETLLSAVMEEPNGREYWAIWLTRPSGELVQLARLEEPLPGLPDGYALVQLGIGSTYQADDVVQYPTISPSGRVVFWGLASGPGASIHALWTGDPDRGIELAVGTGDVFVDRYGEAHEIWRTGGSFEINENDDIAVLVQASDGRTALLRVSPGCGACAAVDIAGSDCQVDLSDLSMLLSSFGECGGVLPADVDSDGCVGLSDLTRILSALGSHCD